MPGDSGRPCRWEDSHQLSWHGCISGPAHSTNLHGGVRLSPSATVVRVVAQCCPVGTSEGDAFSSSALGLPPETSQPGMDGKI